MISSPFSTTGIKLVNEEQDGQQCHQYNESNHTLVVLQHTCSTASRGHSVSY